MADDQDLKDLYNSNVISFGDSKNTDDSDRPDYSNIPVTVSSTAKRMSRTAPEIVSFHRTELDIILNVYSFKVAAGEWRDYAIDMLKDKAIFSIYKNSRDVPLHCIEKDPKLANKQGAYSVTGTDGRVLKRGSDLATVIKVLDKQAKLKAI